MVFIRYRIDTFPGGLDEMYSCYFKKERRSEWMQMAPEAYRIGGMWNRIGNVIRKPNIRTFLSQHQTKTKYDD